MMKRHAGHEASHARPPIGDGMRLRILAAAVLLLGGIAAAAQEPPATRPADGAARASAARPARIDLRMSRFVDLHYAMRHYAELPADKRPEEYQAAANAAAAVNAALSGPLGWGILESALFEASDVAAAKAMAERLPTEFQSMSGAKLPLRELAMQLVKAYEPIETRFGERIWPEHEKSLRTERARLDQELMPHAAKCLAYIERSFRMEDVQATIPVYLLALAPSPGAFTHRRRGGGGVCFVGVDERPGMMVETILHECVHALDISTQSQPTALNTLRKDLQSAGLPPRSELMRSVPHTLMFVQSGETVRRLLEPQHKHYGDVAGYYAKVPESVAAVRAPWTAYLDEKLSLEAALRQIIEKTPLPPK
jgi:hypothetical protein